MPQLDHEDKNGYNIQNFDISYLVDRAKHLKISPQVLKFSRIANALCRVRSTTFSSAQMGTRQNKLVDLDGRIVFDVFQVKILVFWYLSYIVFRLSCAITSCEVTV
jgi:DNA polymerase delta subunit 1